MKFFRLSILLVLVFIILFPGVSADIRPPNTAETQSISTLTSVDCIGTFTNGAVAGIAEAHSLDMAIGKTAFGHDGFTERLNQLRASLNFATAGENVGYAIGQSNPVKVIVDGWMQKTDHRANILGDFQLSGIGAAQGPDGEIYITQIFLKTN